MAWKKAGHNHTLVKRPRVARPFFYPFMLGVPCQMSRKSIFMGLEYLFNYPKLVGVRVFIGIKNTRLIESVDAYLPMGV